MTPFCLQIFHLDLAVPLAPVAAAQGLESPEAAPFVSSVSSWRISIGRETASQCRPGREEADVCCGLRLAYMERKNAPALCPFTVICIRKVTRWLTPGSHLWKMQPATCSCLRQNLCTFCFCYWNGLSCLSLTETHPVPRFSVESFYL